MLLILFDDLGVVMADNEKDSKEIVLDLVSEVDFVKNVEKDDLDIVSKSNDSSSDIKNRIINLVNECKVIQKELSKEIFGQNKAISVFVSGYFQSRLNIILGKNDERPAASFLFVGPKGTGKSMLGKTAAKILSKNVVVINMAEYIYPNSLSDFINKLESIVKANSDTIIIFDDIEEAIPFVTTCVSQIIDNGKLVLGDNKCISFSNNIIIVTSSAGKTIYERSNANDFSDLSNSIIMSALYKETLPKNAIGSFPESICNSFSYGKVVLFNHLSAGALLSICKKSIQNEIDIINSKVKCKISVNEKIYASILYAEGGKPDARIIASKSISFIQNEYYEAVRLINSKYGNEAFKNIEEISFKVELPKNKNVKNLFKSSHKEEVLLLASNKNYKKVKDYLKSFIVHHVTNLDDARKVLLNQKISLILLELDLSNDVEGLLNVADEHFESNNLVKEFSSKVKKIPTYMIQFSDNALIDEEKQSFIEYGVKDILLANQGLKQSLNDTIYDMYQRQSFFYLTKENKTLSYETSQVLSNDGKKVVVNMYDLRLVTSMNAEDTNVFVSSDSVTYTRFSDIIGAEDAKAELSQYVDYLQSPEKYISMGLEMPRGVILYGPPGTGKTKLARAIASESGVSFIPMEGNRFVKKYYGEGPQLVHDIFEKARKYAPSVLFIDEVDIIARTRDTDSNYDVQDIMTAIFTEMDGFVKNPDAQVFVLAATNYDVKNNANGMCLDPAFVRRFDRCIYIDLPNKAERKQYLSNQLSGDLFDISKTSISNFAERTPGMSIAQLELVIKMAKKKAIREKIYKVDEKILDESLEEYLYGEEHAFDEESIHRTAIHECGHALVSFAFGEKPSYVTIVSRGNFGGYMQHESKEDKCVYTKEDLLALIRTSLAGRAAEIVFYGKENGITTGASADFEHATTLALDMLCRYSMFDDLGISTIYMKQIRTGQIPEVVTSRVNEIISTEMENTINIIKKNKTLMNKFVNKLMEKTHMNQKEIIKILDGKVSC